MGDCHSQGDTSASATPINVLEMMRQFRDDPEDGESAGPSEELNGLSLDAPQDPALEPEPGQGPAPGPAPGSPCSAPVRLLEPDHEGDTDSCSSTPSTPTKQVPADLPLLSALLPLASEPHLALLGLFTFHQHDQL